jgi:hypothetical protein
LQQLEVYSARNIDLAMTNIMNIYIKDKNLSIEDLIAYFSKIMEYYQGRAFRGAFWQEYFYKFLEMYCPEQMSYENFIKLFPMIKKLNIKFFGTKSQVSELTHYLVNQIIKDPKNSSLGKLIVNLAQLHSDFEKSLKNVFKDAFGRDKKFYQFRKENKNIKYLYQFLVHDFPPYLIPHMNIPYPPEIKDFILGLRRLKTVDPKDKTRRLVPHIDPYVIEQMLGMLGDYKNYEND